MKEVFLRYFQKKLKIISNLSESRLIATSSLFFVLTCNYGFFSNVYKLYVNQDNGLIFIVSLATTLWAILTLLLVIISFGILLRPILALLCLIAAAVSYFSDKYNTVIDITMLDNIVQTNKMEAIDLLSTELVFRLVFLGLLPGVLILFKTVRLESYRDRVQNRVKLIGFCLLVIGVGVVPNIPAYASFFREHKILRYYTNPITPLYSATYKLLKTIKKIPHYKIILHGEDAKISKSHTPNKLVILVVGETARSDHFQINGYKGLTNPLLNQRNVISFKNMTSCGTATAYSVPCMFSIFSEDEFDIDTSSYHENVLDILNHTGVAVIWRDNNSDSKGVAARVERENFQKNKTSVNCYEECRDTILIEDLDKYISLHQDQDILIVLHQMGSHGPAYFKRYPNDFEKFTPACHSPELMSCSNNEIINAYDNTLLYTDFFLDKAINLLEKEYTNYQTALFYVSDHGESLGEHGLYLHGLPKILAPKEQINIASILWFSENFDTNIDRVLDKKETPLSHDNISHTLMGLFDINTNQYDPALDLTK